MTTSFETFLLLSPEITLFLAALIAYLAAAFSGFQAGWLIAVTGLGIAISLSGSQPESGATISSGPITIDGFSFYIRLLTYTAGLMLALVQSGDYWKAAVQDNDAEERRRVTGEEAGTFLILLVGLSLVGLANDLVLLFIGLELVSIPTYILLALKRTDAAGQEASLKYFFLSLVASALFLYSVVCLYGLGGSTSLPAIGNQLQSLGCTIAPIADDSIAVGTITISMAAVLLPVTLGMAFAGAAFRMAAVPMHFYAPDVYEGTSTSNTALLSTLPKIAGVVMLSRLIALAIPPLGSLQNSGPIAETLLLQSWQVIAIIAAITMTVGNCMALLQNNLRRLFACSSIAHAGYLLVGLAALAAAAGNRRGLLGGESIEETALSLNGLGSTLFYLATYIVATIGFFGGLTYLGHRWPEWSTSSDKQPQLEEIKTVDDLNGLSSTNPVAAFCLATFLLSLMGIPPLAGFWGKLSLVTSSLSVDSGNAVFGDRKAWFIGLSVVLVLNAAIAAAYYLRLITAMYFKSTDKGVQADGGLSSGLAMIVCLIVLVSISIRPQGLFNSALQAGNTLSGTLVTETMALFTTNTSTTSNMLTREEIENEIR
jgi:NADH-quinone oxidoreductase subunit N